MNADDVECIHGGATSDLEEDQLFYFEARGIDALTARSALVFSFGAEVMQKLGNERLQKRLGRPCEIITGLRGHLKYQCTCRTSRCGNADTIVDSFVQLKLHLLPHVSY